VRVKQTNNVSMILLNMWYFISLRAEIKIRFQMLYFFLGSSCSTSQWGNLVQHPWVHHP